MKKTEIGWIPEDWDCVKLKTICHRIFVGIATSTSEYYTEDGIPIIRNQNIKENQIADDDLLKISKEFSEANKSRKLMTGDIITARTGYPGMSCVVPQRYEGAHTFTTLVSRPDKEKIFPHFLSRYINSDIGKKIVLSNQAGGAQQNLNAGRLKEIPIALPQLPEQKKIASILTTVDDKISSTDQQIQQTEQLKKGLMEKLLTEGIGHTEFKETKVGRIPKGWEVSTLGEHIQLISGQHINSGDYNELGKGVPYITGPNDYPNGKVLPTKFTENPQMMCKAKDILITCKGSGAGSLAIAEMDCCISRQIMAIRPQSMVRMFVFPILEKAQNSFRNNAVGLIPGISRPDILNFSIPLPCLEEQKQIATILSTVDNKIEVLNQKKTHYQTLKKGLSQQLLTGQMRVKI